MLSYQAKPRETWMRPDVLVRNAKERGRGREGRKGRNIGNTQSIAYPVF